MPRLRSEDLQRIGYQLFAAAGCSATDARIVVDHLVESSLFGHDSHGSLRLYEYIDQIRRKIFDPRGRPRLVQERMCTAVVDGGGALGQIGATFATHLAMHKAREHGVAAVTLRNCGHVGRVGAYPLQAARQGLIGLVFCNAGHLGRQIAPYGGLDGRLSTNPIAFAAPRRQGDPLMVDMATSVTAEGKIRVAKNRRQPLPQGWIIDRQGRPSTDPDEYLDGAGGAILPLGGVAAYKGYCLSFIVEILGGALSGQGCAAGETEMQSNGLCIVVYDLEHFIDRDFYFNELESLIRHVRTSRIDPQIGEILLPGEPEFRTARQRHKDGIPVDETTWKRMGEAARQLGLDPAAWEEQVLGN
jgi:uncharacterized oxidoreductase